MLYIKEGSVLVKLDSWEQVYSRPSYVVDLDLKGKALNELIGFYKDEPPRTCGIKSCHNAHKKGAIVVTEDGLETCIGHMCGSAIFKEKFETLIKNIEKEVDFEVYKETVTNKKSKIFEYWQKAAELTVGANSVLKLADKIEQLRDPLAVGRYASMELTRMAANRQTKVVSEQFLSEKKKDFDDIDSDEKDKVERVVIGQIQHIEILSRDNDLKKLYYEEIDHVLTSLQYTDLNNISPRQLLNIGRRAAMLDVRIARANELKDTAVKFLRKRNLMPLYKKMFPMEVVSRKDLMLYKNFIDSL